MTLVGVVSVTMMMMLWLAVGSDVIYPQMYGNQQLVTRLNCQVREPQHFHYASVTRLWGSMGGHIALDADITILCLGADLDGKFENEALKYKVEITNLKLTENKGSEKLSLELERHKRSVGEFFTKSWDRVKSFFKRVFRRKPPEETRTTQDTPITDETEIFLEPEEDINMDDYQSIYPAPFLFVQMANGTIPEIRFSENEVDNRVKNFKRHLVDAFSTQLNFEQKNSAVLEKSVVGEHTSNYNITVRDHESPSLSVAGFGGSPQQEHPTVVVKKFITEDDILRLAPSEALNDREKMNLQIHQEQVFQGGRMISSSGLSLLDLLPDSEQSSNRVKRDTEDEDVTSYMRAHSFFDIKIQKRQRRSAEKSFNGYDDDETYVSASRVAESEGNPERRNGQSPSSELKLDDVMLNKMMSGRDSEYDLKIQALFDVVEREVSLEFENESESISSSLRRSLSPEVMHDLCKKNFSICKDFLQLLALIGGTEAENVFLSFLSHEAQHLPITHVQMIADILSDISKPSSHFIHSLTDMANMSTMDADTLGIVCLSLGHIASKANEEDQRLVTSLLRDLMKQKQNSCQSDPMTLDVLEAIGNLGSNEDVVADVLKVSEMCGQEGAVQIACIHALRHSSHLPQIRQWIHRLISSGDCDVLRGVVGSLMDKIQDQELTPNVNSWPRFGFNDIDVLLKSQLETARCPTEDILLYFNRKKDREANDISRNHFVPESEPWNPDSNSRQKRSAWDELNCKEWTEDDGKYRPVQDKEEFLKDKATYNRRKSCLAFRRLGVKRANAEIYAGMFAGVKQPSDPPKYKLFTKFASALNFLGHQMEIGSFHFYLQNGSTKAYVRILGRTRQEFKNEGCTPMDLRYRPLKHIPLYLVNVGPLQLSLGIHLSSQLAMDTVCLEGEVYRLEPVTNARIGGEAIGTVLFTRGAVNLGGNFNYKLQFTVTPSPDMCLKGSHGYDPMSVSFETYYQYWNKLKDDWGKTRVWRPSFLSWDVSRRDFKPWFDDTCLGISDSSSSPLNEERELE